ncbi:hypothetical protein [Streptomyces syringium]|uniref:hypothetical protein n=1 Tax=Streptomyces syringium TaxID=76729 RepID=UPI0037CDB137
MTGGLRLLREYDEHAAAILGDPDECGMSIVASPQGAGSCRAVTGRRGGAPLSAPPSWPRVRLPGAGARSRVTP